MFDPCSISKLLVMAHLLNIFLFRNIEVNTVVTIVKQTPLAQKRSIKFSKLISRDFCPSSHCYYNTCMYAVPRILFIILCEVRKCKKRYILRPNRGC